MQYANGGGSPSIISYSYLNLNSQSWVTLSAFMSALDRHLHFPSNILVVRYGGDKDEVRLLILLRYFVRLRSGKYEGKRIHAKSLMLTC